MSITSDPWMRGFFIFVAVVLVYQIFCGWQRGLARQIFYIFSIVFGYAAGFYGSRYLVPLLRPLGYPDFLMSLAGGAVLGGLVMLVLSLFGSLVLKKTSQQSVGIIRFFYGLSGGILGFCIGLFFIWIAVLGIRLLGTVAELELRTQPLAKGTEPKRELPPAVKAIAEMKHSFDGSSIGPMSSHVDPIPANAYEVLRKTVRLVSDPEALQRLVKYPGSKPLVEHPKMIALAKDPEILDLIRKGDLNGLLKNKHVLEVTNDPEMMELVKKFDFDKALDFSLTPVAKGRIPETAP